jgi:3-methyladenine DNA glycosylase AlkD
VAGVDGGSVASMTWEESEYAAFVSAEMERLGDPRIARDKAAYMYGKRFQTMNPDLEQVDPFHGVQGAGVRLVEREIRERFKIETAADYVAAVTALWELPHREEKYLATAVAYRHKRFITFERLPLYRRMITEGAWWDLVDSVAPRCIGHLLKTDRARMGPELDRWIEDDDMWIRRSALIAHLKLKDETNEAQLFDHCRRTMYEPEFFIRKAIGWALRQYARTDPDAVRRFALEYRDVMSGLSFREATKHLTIQ